MENLTSKLNTHNKIAVTLLAIVALSASAFFAYFSYDREQYLTHLEGQYASSTEALQTLEAELSRTQKESGELANLLHDREREIEDLIEEISEAEGTVDILTRLTTIDPELLKKYSRVYFLNEHYRPAELEQIDKKWWYPADDDEFIHKDVWPFLRDLLRDAERDDIDLRIISAFRTFDRQRELKSQYDIVYGEGTANQFSAVQGYSEHQLGTTVDFTTEELGGNFTQLAQTEAYQWLLDNAYKYGFVLSYPENNQYYKFEPWHWRFVGKDLARTLDRREINFYDMDQREIDSYRLNIFER